MALFFFPSFHWLLWIQRLFGNGRFNIFLETDILPTPSHDHVLCRCQLGVGDPWEGPGYSGGTSGNQKLERSCQEAGSVFPASPYQWTSGPPLGTRCFGLQTKRKVTSEISSFSFFFEDLTFSLWFIFTEGRPKNQNSKKPHGLCCSPWGHKESDTTEQPSKKPKRPSKVLGTLCWDTYFSGVKLI